MIWKNLDILLLLNNTVKRSMTIVYKSLQTADTDDKNMAVPASQSKIQSSWALGVASLVQNVVYGCFAWLVWVLWPVMLALLGLVG